MNRAAEALAQSDLDRDAADIRRGALVNFVGYLLRAANPVLLILVVRAYGAELFGFYSLAQAVMLLSARVAALGLDKGLLWWVPRLASGDVSGVRPALKTAALSSLLVSAVLMLAASPAVLSLFGASAELTMPLRIMVLGLLPQVWMDLLVHAAMGRRRMEAHVFVKDTLVPISLVAFALSLYLMGFERFGLPLAFVLSNVGGLLAALWAAARVFRDGEHRDDEGLRPPRELTQYAWPMWLSEMSNSLLQRMDTYAVALLTGDLALVGIYAVVTRVSNTVRSIRRSFDAIVLAIVSEIGNTPDSRRLRAGFSYATFLVTLTQLPIFAFLVAFAEPLMGLFGEGFEAGAPVVLVLCGFWIVNGLLSLSGIVVSAYGRSRMTLFNVLFAIVVLGLCSLWLVPAYGLLGAALSVGIAYTLQHLVQLVQMRVVTGAFNYDLRVVWPLALAAGAFVAMWLVWSPIAPESTLVQRTAAFGTFGVVYGAGVLFLRGRGYLSFK